MTFPSIDLIHIGFHKTASTFLQNQYFPNLRGVFRLNHSYPIIDLDDWFFQNFININPHSYNRNEFIELFSEKLNLISVKPKEEDLFLISDENLSGDPDHGLDSKTLLERIYQTFGVVNILIVIRNQPDYLLSTYSNYILHGGITSLKRWINGPETRWGLIKQKVRYSHLVEDYMNTFGREKVHVICYENLWCRESGLPSVLSKFGVVHDETLLNRSRIMVGRTLFANNMMAFMNRFGLSGIPYRGRISAIILGGSSDRDNIKSWLGDDWDMLLKDNQKLEKIINRDLHEKYFT